MFEPEKLDALRQARAEWEATTLKKTLARAPERAG